MDSRLFIKPSPGKKVRDPKTMQYLPDEGAFVDADSYWLRRIEDGSVEKSEPVAKKKKAVSKPAKNEVAT